MKKYIILYISLFLFSCQQSKEIKNTKQHQASKSSIITEKEPVVEKAPTFVMNEPPSVPPVKITTADTIAVSSLKEIVENAGDNKVLRLKKGTYTIDENLVYYITKEKQVVIDKKVTETRSIGGQVYISGLTNFSIIGDQSKIISKNPKAISLFLLRIYQGTFQNLHIGHTENNAAKVTASSTYISKSEKLQFTNCTLGQNSQLSIKLQAARNLTFDNCRLSESSGRVLDTNELKNIEFLNSDIANNNCLSGCFNIWGTDNVINFRNTKIKSNISTSPNPSSSMLFNGPSPNINLENCVIQGNKSFGQIGLTENNFKSCKVQKF